MLNDIYNKRIIELAGNIPRLGQLAAPDASATAHSKLCGSTVKVDVKMDGPLVTDFAHDVKACALGQASSSIMARNVVGSTAGELRALRETVRKMLKENGSPAPVIGRRGAPARCGPPRNDDSGFIAAAISQEAAAPRRYRRSERELRRSWSISPTEDLSQSPSPC